MGFCIITIEKPRELTMAGEIAARPTFAKADALLTTMIAGELTI